MSKILVVDDEPGICEVVKLYLQHAGYTVQVASNGTDALQSLAASLPDLVILDVMMPGVDGLEITRRLRMVSDTPIIFLTARREESDRVLGLELGADDYVVKPFSPRELVSRVRAVLRRTQGAERRPEQETVPLTFDRLTIDSKARLAYVQGQAVALTAKEFDLLWFLANHPQQVYNRDQLLAEVWGRAQFIDASTVTVHVRRLREKLEVDPAEPHFVQTVWGVGYRFNG